MYKRFFRDVTRMQRLIFITFFLFFNVSMAATAPSYTFSHTRSRKASFYVNVDVGVNILSAPSNNHLVGEVGSSFLEDMVYSGRATNTAAAASMGFGYLFPVNRWFNLGLRAFVHYENSYNLYNVDYQIPAASFLVSSSTLVKLRNWEYGVDLTPSVNIGANQFLTGIFGLAFNRARIDASGAVYQNLVTTVREFVLKRSVTGARLGFNLEQLVSPNFGLYMSYIWTGYGSVNLDERGPNAFHLINSNNFQTHNILVGLKYYFSRQNYQSLRRAMVNHFNRFYVSLSVGNLIPQIEDSSFGNFFEQSNKLSFSHINQGSPVTLGILGLGRGFLFHHFYLGAEILLNAAERFSTSKIDYEDNPRNWLRTTNIRLNAAEGAFDLKLGGIIAPQTLLIGRIGVALNTVHLANLMDSSPAGVPGVGPQIIQNVSKRVAAPRFGLGIERLFSGNFSLVANYIYTYYGHITASESTPVAAQFIQNTVNARVATHAVSIGVNYYFA